MAQSETWCQFCGAWESFNILARTYSQNMRTAWVSLPFCFSFSEISSCLSIMCPKWPRMMQALSMVYSFICLWQKCLNDHKFTVENSLWLQANAYVQGHPPVWRQYYVWWKTNEKEYLKMRERRNKMNQYLRLTTTLQPLKQGRSWRNAVKREVFLTF